MEIEKRIRVAEQARIWGVTPQHVYNLIRDGRLPHIRIGNVIRLRAEDVADYENRPWQDPEPSHQPSTSRPSQDAAPPFISRGGKTGELSAFQLGQMSKARLSGS
jgi:excisionase family DNA binding protein